MTRGDFAMSTTFVFNLEGSQQVPAVASAARGVGSVIYDSATGTADYTIYVRGLDFGPLTSEPSQTAQTTDDVTDAHFHAGAAGANGGVVFGWPGDDDFTATLQADGWWKIHGVWEPSEGINPFAAQFASATQ